MSDKKYYTDTQVIDRVYALLRANTYCELEKIYRCSASEFWRAHNYRIVRPALRRALGMEQDKPPRYRLALEFDTMEERERMRALLAHLGDSRKEQSAKLMEMLEEMT